MNIFEKLIQDHVSAGGSLNEVTSQVNEALQVFIRKNLPSLKKTFKWKHEGILLAGCDSESTEKPSVWLELVTNQPINLEDVDLTHLHMEEMHWDASDSGEGWLAVEVSYGEVSIRGVDTWSMNHFSGNYDLSSDDWSDGEFDPDSLTWTYIMYLDLDQVSEDDDEEEDEDEDEDEELRKRGCVARIGGGVMPEIIKLVLNDHYKYIEGDVNIRTVFATAWDKDIRQRLVSWHKGKRGADKALIRSLVGMAENDPRIERAKVIVLCSSSNNWAIFLDRDVGTLEVSLSGVAVGQKIAHVQEIHWRNSATIKL